MSAASPDQALGAYLKALRVHAGLDVAVLARRLSLSPAQLLQLENGQASLFYNHRIRQQAARKVISHLGGDPSRVQDEPIPVATASAPQAPASPAPPEEVAGEEVSVAVKPVRLLRLARVAPVLLALLVGGAVWMSGVWSPPSEGMNDLAKAPASWTESVPSAPQPPVEAASLKLAMADPEATAVQVAVRDEPGQTAVAKAPTATSDSCPGEAEQAPAVQPPEARKAGDMVYVVSLGTVSVCLSDGSGKQQRKRLEAGQSHSFYGAPPWVVRSDQLRQTQLYFQGWKVRLPEQAQDSIKLVELR